MKWKRLKEIVKKWIRFLINPRLLLCFGIAWIFTNGWSYILFAIGTYFSISWLVAVSGAYMAFLWLPFTPEKIITVVLSIVLLRFLFPKDQKTLAVLIEMREKYRNAAKTRFNILKNKRKIYKNQKYDHK